MSKSPIGVFDSGIGGLSVVFEMNKLLPNENIEYLADHARQPYGPREKKEIISFVIEIVNYLMSKKIKACIIGCNTATAAGLESAQKYFKIPIIGVIEPGVKAAVESTKSGRIGLIATEFTVKSQEHMERIKKADPDLQVFANPCPEFFRLVETGQFEGEETYQIATEYLEPLKMKAIDTLILGCTHYPFLSKVIQEIMGPKVTLINPAYNTVLEMKNILEKNHLINDSTVQKSEHYYTTGNPEKASDVANIIAGYQKCQFKNVKL